MTFLFVTRRHLTFYLGCNACINLKKNLDRVDDFDYDPLAGVEDDGSCNISFYIPLLYILIYVFVEC